MLGSVAEAARLVATRNIRFVHALPGVEHALPSAAGGAGGGAGAGAGATAGLDGLASAGGGGNGVTGETAAAAAAGDHVPLFR